MTKTNTRTRASIALQNEYKKKLMKLIADMTKSVNWWLIARYRQNLGEIIATDSASSELEAELRKLFKQWGKKYDHMAHDISSWFTNASRKHTDRNLKSILKDYGFTVNNRLTRKQKATLRALTVENVNLIRSIHSRYFSELTTITMQSISRGRDLKYMQDELQKQYGVCKRRAELIARDQNNKATAVITHMRYEEVGITHAIWKHNSGAKEPRHTHLVADGKEYDIRKGLYFKDKGRHIFPGEEINCSCTSYPIVDTFPHVRVAKR